MSRATGVAAARGRVLLINPRITSRRHARFPLSIMTLAAALEGRYDATLIDGNLDRDAARTACDAIEERDVRRRRRHRHGRPAGRYRDRGVAGRAPRAPRPADRLGRLLPDAVSGRRAQSRLCGLRGARSGRGHVRRSCSKCCARRTALRCEARSSSSRRRRGAQLETGARRRQQRGPRARTARTSRPRCAMAICSATRAPISRAPSSASEPPATRPRSAAGSAARSAAWPRCSTARRCCRPRTGSTAISRS